MKLTSILTLSAALFINAATAQKVDLDKFNFEIEYLSLPTHYLPPEQRTYSASVSLSPMSQAVVTEEEALKRLSIANFSNKPSGGVVQINMQLGNTLFNRSEVKMRTEQTKDDKGNVTATKYYYSVQASYTTDGKYVITGPKNPYKNEKQTAKEKKRDKKKDGEEPKEGNPFLKDAPAATTEGTGSTLTITGTPGGYRSFTTQESRSSEEASRSFRLISEGILLNLHADFVNGTLREAGARLNDLYGYVPVKEAYFLWILDSKSHPEYQMQQNAIQAVKELLGRVKAEASTAALETALKPVMDYFESLKTKYTGDDKREKKLRYSAYFNLAKLYLVLDYPDKAIEQAQGLIKNDFDTEDGDALLEKAEELKHRLEFHHINTRHLGKG